MHDTNNSGTKRGTERLTDQIKILELLGSLNQLNKEVRRKRQKIHVQRSTQLQLK